MRAGTAMLIRGHLTASAQGNSSSSPHPARLGGTPDVERSSAAACLLSRGRALARLPARPTSARSRSPPARYRSIARARRCRPGSAAAPEQRRARTGTDGSVGITMRDNSLLSIGPNSILALDVRVRLDHGRGPLRRAAAAGTLAVVSGRIAKQSPEAMKVRTPAAVLGVRGTEFVVSVDESRRGDPLGGAAGRRAAPRRRKTDRAAAQARGRNGADGHEGSNAGRPRAAVRGRPRRPRRRSRRIPSNAWRSRRVRLGAGGAALPPAPFTLFFVEGKDEFTDESKRDLDGVFAEIAKRPIPDVDRHRPHRHGRQRRAQRQRCRASAPTRARRIRRPAACRRARRGRRPRQARACSSDRRGRVRAAQPARRDHWFAEASAWPASGARAPCAASPARRSSATPGA